MRYINRDSIVARVPHLVAAAEEARQEILLETDPNRRADLIDRHRDKWIAFRPAFEELSHDKCWYVECKNHGADDDIDHFRPKGRVAEDRDHGGYWWEALNWRNFRLSCHRANRLRVNPESGDTCGKGDHFPLLREEDRCRTPADDLSRESPMLLDPTDPFDPPLITFDIDGTVALSPDFEADADAGKRVQLSREFLHLDWPAFKEARQQLYSAISVMVSDGERLLRPPAAAGHIESVKMIARDLIDLTRDEKPYSMAAKAYISRFRHIPWVKRAVLPHFA